MTYLQLKSFQFAEVAKSLRASLAHFGLCPDPSSDIAKMIREMEWLGAFSDNASQPDAAWATDRERALAAFPQFEQARRISEALAWIRGIPGSDEKVRHLNKRLNRLVTQNAKAQDDLVEIEIAQRLIRRGFNLAFGDPPREPDVILVGSDGTKFGLECKRPRSIKRVSESLRKAAHQISASQFCGIILIGLESILHSPGTGKHPVTFLGEPQELKAMASERCAEVIHRSSVAIEAAFRHRRVLGILLCGICTAWAEELWVDGKKSGGYIYHWVRESVVNPNSEVMANGTSAEVAVQGMKWFLSGDTD